ncbi:hypothetical protein ABK040_011046 [Willaertia magna]
MFETSSSNEQDPIYIPHQPSNVNDQASPLFEEESSEKAILEESSQEEFTAAINSTPLLFENIVENAPSLSFVNFTQGFSFTIPTPPLLDENSSEERVISTTQLNDQQSDLKENVSKFASSQINQLNTVKKESCLETAVTNEICASQFNPSPPLFVKSSTVKEVTFDSSLNDEVPAANDEVSAANEEDVFKVIKSMIGGSFKLKGDKYYGNFKKTLKYFKQQFTITPYQPESEFNLLKFVKEMKIVKELKQKYIDVLKEQYLNINTTLLEEKTGIAIDLLNKVSIIYKNEGKLACLEYLKNWYLGTVIINVCGIAALLFSVCAEEDDEVPYPGDANNWKLLARLIPNNLWMIAVDIKIKKVSKKQFYEFQNNLPVNDHVNLYNFGDNVFEMKEDDEMSCISTNESLSSNDSNEKQMANDEHQNVEQMGDCKNDIVADEKLTNTSNENVVKNKFTESFVKQLLMDYDICALKLLYYSDFKENCNAYQSDRQVDIVEVLKTFQVLKPKCNVLTININDLNIVQSEYNSLTMKNKRKIIFDAKNYLSVCALLKDNRDELLKHFDKLVDSQDTKTNCLIALSSQLHNIKFDIESSQSRYTTLGKAVKDNLWLIIVPIRIRVITHTFVKNLINSEIGKDMKDEIYKELKEFIN